MNTQSSYLSAFGRLLIAAIFIMSGLGKIAAPAMTQGYIGSVGLPAPVIAYFAAIAIEVVGGVLLVIGYQTRIVAAVMAIFAIATAVFFHRDFADQNQMIHFLKNLAMAGGLLQVVAFGPGSFSLDGRNSARAVA